MSNIDKLLKQKKTVEKLAVAKERLTGYLEAEKKKLVEIYGVPNLRQARQLLEELGEKIEKKQEKFDRLVEQIEAPL